MVRTLLIIVVNRYSIASVAKWEFDNAFGTSKRKLHALGFVGTSVRFFFPFFLSNWEIRWPVYSVRLSSSSLLLLMNTASHRRAEMLVSIILKMANTIISPKRWFLNWEILSVRVLFNVRHYH